MQITHFRETIKRHPSVALVFAAIFHLLITLSVFAAGRAALAPRQFDLDGIGDFASDGHIHKPAMEALALNLRHGEFREWLGNPGGGFHVKLYSVVAVAFEPLVGSNILTIEPINLLCYLGILLFTFWLTSIVGDSRAAWWSTLVVALWPSLLLHTTQFLRDPLIIVATLGVLTVLVRVLKQVLNWRRAGAAVLLAAGAIYIAWHTRPDMWLVITAIIFVATFLCVVKIAVTRNFLAANLLSMVAIALLSIGMPRPAASFVSLPLSGQISQRDTNTTSSAPSIWVRIAVARDAFFSSSRGSGSVIDQDVHFKSATGIVTYVPRALEIGYFAPFPSLWFGGGNKVGTVGRTLSGFEMMLTYLFEVLTCLFLWRTRKRYSSWLLIIATSIGMVALGLVVNNVGTLYRMRYPFWILIVVMAASAIATNVTWPSSEEKISTPGAIPSQPSTPG